MKTSKTSAKTYLVTFAAIVALPFALHAGGDSYQQNSAANPTEAPSTRVGANAEDVNSTTAVEGQNTDTGYTAGSHRNDATYTDAGPNADAFDTDTNAPMRDNARRDGTIASDTRRNGSTDRDMIVTGPEVDGSSRNANGVARAPNELKARQLDIAVSQRQNPDAKVRVGEPEVQDYDTSAAPSLHRHAHTRADLNREDAVAMQLNTEATTDNIESTEFENRDLAITMAESGVTEGKQIVLALRTNGATTTPEARKDLDKAIRKVEQAEQKLNGAITGSRNATQARWDDAREELADRYEDYAEALEDAREVAVDGGVRFQSQVSVDSDLPSDRS